MPTQMQKQYPKMDYAKAAAWQFIDSFHIEGLDQGMICTFADSFAVSQPFTTSKAKLASALVKAQPGGQTLLYDSMQKMVETFWHGQHGRDAARRDVPWLEITLTDGLDNQSRIYPCNDRTSPKLLGSYI